MRDFSLDELPVCAENGGKAHVLVVDAEFISFAKQVLSQEDHWTLTQVVGPRLETQSVNSDPFLADRRYRPNCAFELLFVARQYCIQNWGGDVYLLREVCDRSQIFWQARTSKCGTGLKVIR